MRTPKRLEVERLLGAGPARLAEPPSQLAVGGEPGERLGEVLRISRRDEHPGFAFDDLLGHSTNSRRDHREPCRHRLEDGHGHALGGARQREDVRRGEQLRDVMTLAGEPDAVGKAEPSNLVLEPRPVGPLADDHCIERAGLEPAERTDERQEVLRRLQAPDGDDQRPLPMARLDARGAGDVHGIGDHDRSDGVARARYDAELPFALGDADGHGRERANEPVGPAVQTPDEAGIRGERPPVHGEDPDRHPRQDSGLRAARMEDVRAVTAEDPDELDEAGEVARSDRSTHVSQWLEPRARRHGRVTQWACAVSRDDDLEALHERRKQRGDVRLGSPDLRERDQQQNPRPPRQGG